MQSIAGQCFTSSRLAPRHRMRSARSTVCNAAALKFWKYQGLGNDFVLVRTC